MKKILLFVFTMFLCVSSYSQWYAHGFELDNNFSSDIGYYWAPIWPDSLVLNEYSDGFSSVWMHGLGQVLDPKSFHFEFSEGGSLTAGNPYFVDSIAFPYNYLRYQTDAADTLIIQFFKQENMDLYEQPWPDWMGMEDASRAYLSYDSALLRSPVPFLEITEILDENDVAEESVSWKSYEIGELIAPGEVVAATVTYIPGNPYNIGDSLVFGSDFLPINLRNQIVLRYYSDFERNFEPLDYNHAFIATDASRYADDSNGWDGQYWTGNATSTNSGIHHADIQFHLSILDNVEEHENYVDLVVYPNPASEVISITFNTTDFEPQYIRIIDNSGKIVYDQQLLNAQSDYAFNLALDGFTNGVYFVQLMNDLRSYNKKFIVKN